MSVNFRVVADLLVEIEEVVDDLPASAPKGMVSSPIEPMLRATVLRFLEAMRSPVDAEVLGPGLLRELYFRVLMGSQGGRGDSDQQRECRQPASCRAGSPCLQSLAPT